MIPLLMIAFGINGGFSPPVDIHIPGAHELAEDIQEQERERDKERGYIIEVEKDGKREEVRVCFL